MQWEVWGGVVASEGRPTVKHFRVSQVCVRLPQVMEVGSNGLDAVHCSHASVAVWDPEVIYFTKLS